MTDATTTAALDIIIPVYNEGENIIAVLNSLATHVKTPCRILICYDHDADTTLTVLKDFKTKQFCIEFVKNKKTGAHGAVTSGFEHSTAPAVLVFPADDTYNAPILDRMYEKLLSGCEIVAASRFMRGGRMEGCPWLKSILVRVASFTLNRIALIPIQDASNGFRMFSRRVLESIIIESNQGFTYSLELLVKCHRLRWKVGEVPASWFERSKGRSRFLVIKWLPAYLRWYFYGFLTTYLRRLPTTVPLKEGSSLDPGNVHQSVRDEIDFFNQYGDQKNYEVLQESGYQRVIREFKKHADWEGLKIIDVGCGTGAFTSRLRNGKAKLHGLDLSEKFIAHAKAKYPDIHFQAGNAEESGYPNGFFDVVLLSGIIHHFPDYTKLLKEQRRILKAGGVLLAFDPHRGNPLMWLYRCKKSPLYSSKGVSPNEEPLSRKKLIQKLQECGFTDIEVRPISGVTFRYVDDVKVRFLLPAYNLIERIIDGIPFLRERFGSFLITYAKN